MYKKILLSMFVVSTSGCSLISAHRANHSLDQIEALGSGKFESQQAFIDYLKYTQSINKYIDYKRGANSNCRGSNCIEEIVVTGSMISNPVITNNQEAGVDEGDIVKVIGDYLVILRQGKLFSVRYGEGALTPVDSIPVIKEGWEHDAWIDELLVYNNTIVVIGYAYEGVSDSDNVELNILSINEDGVFTHENAYIIQAGDYFSGNDYASRIVDGKLIFNFPISFEDFEFGTLDDSRQLQFARIGHLPDTPEKAITWQRLLDSKDIFKPVEIVIYPNLHVYVKCDLDSSKLNQCTSSGVISTQYSISSYVTTQAIYFTTASLKKPYIIDAEFDWSLEADDNNYQYNLHKIDLETMSQSAIPINGSPFNRFSFYEKGNTFYLVTSKNYDDDESFDIFLNTVEQSDFQIPSYIPNPQLLGNYNGERWLETRFVGDWLAVGDSASFWESKNPNSPTLTLYEIESLQSYQIGLEHSAERMEPLNDSLLVMGYSGDEQFHGSVVTLGNSPQLLATHYFEGVVEGENRSHAFNSTSLPNGSDLFGFTTLKLDSTSSSSFYYDDQPSDIYFVEVLNDDSIRPAGIFESKQNAEEVDGDCTVSCIDWYGNTRPFFLEGKIYGLTGYELIKGEYFQGEIRENSRVDYRLTR
ncbi:hypothetical protein NBRC116493_13720 [Aurantivibrio infirmus]